MQESICDISSAFEEISSSMFSSLGTSKLHVKGPPKRNLQDIGLNPPAG